MPRGGAARSARVAHNHKVAGSNPAPATKKKDSPCDCLFSWLLGQDTNLRFCEAKVARFGVVNEAKESTKYFLERVNGGAK